MVSLTEDSRRLGGIREANGIARLLLAAIDIEQADAIQIDCTVSPHGPNCDQTWDNYIRPLDNSGRWGCAGACTFAQDGTEPRHPLRGVCSSPSVRSRTSSQ